MTVKFPDQNPDPDHQEIQFCSLSFPELCLKSAENYVSNPADGPTDRQTQS